MKKQFLNLGKALSKAEQKSINGGVFGACNHLGDTGQHCINHSDCLGTGDPVCYLGCCNTLV